MLLPKWEEEEKIEGSGRESNIRGKNLRKYLKAPIASLSPSLPFTCTCITSALRNVIELIPLCRERAITAK